jgi:DNA-binding XRE family transcriptional regulator
MKINIFFKEKRKEKNLTQEDLSIILNVTVDCIYKKEK